MYSHICRYVILSLFVLAVLACKENNTVRKENSSSQTISFTGQIKIYGNEPHTYVGVVSSDGAKYIVDQAYQNALRELAPGVYKFTGYINKTTDTPALFVQDGIFVPIRYTRINE